MLPRAPIAASSAARLLQHKFITNQSITPFPCRKRPHNRTTTRLRETIRDGSLTDGSQGRFTRRPQRVLLARCSKRPASPKLPRSLTHGTRRPLAKRQRSELVRERRERRRTGRSCTETRRDEEDQATRGGRDAEGYGSACTRQRQRQS